MKIDKVYIPLEQEWKRIGISLSGGADSALLAYLILSNTNADIYFTTQIRMWKTRPWQRWIAKDVVGWFREKFNNRIEHIEGFIPPEMEEPTEYLIKDEYGSMKSEIVLYYVLTTNTLDICINLMHGMQALH